MYWYAYAIWWLRAGNSHGLHSPFAYQLYTHWLRKKGATLIENATDGLNRLGIASIRVTPINLMPSKSHSQADCSAWIATDIRANPTHYRTFSAQSANPNWQLVIDLGTIAIFVCHPHLSTQRLQLNPRKHNWF